MKKLNLNRNTFAGGETLTREQLKKIMGGDGPETTAPGDDFSTTDAPGCGNECEKNADCEGKPYPNCNSVYDQGCQKTRKFCTN